MVKRLLWQELQGRTLVRVHPLIQTIKIDCFFLLQRSTDAQIFKFDSLFFSLRLMSLKRISDTLTLVP